MGDIKIGFLIGIGLIGAFLVIGLVAGLVSRA